MFDEQRSLHAARYPIDEALQHLQDGTQTVLKIPTGPYLAILLSQIARKLSRPLAVVAPSNRVARQLHDGFSALVDARRGEQATLIPPLDISPYAETTPDHGLSMQRMMAVSEVSRLRAGQVMVGSSVAWSLRMPPDSILQELSRSFGMGDEIDTAALRAALVAGGYTETGIVEDPGHFSMRGDVIDIYDPSQKLPLRVELYGDSVESIRSFDPRTQRSQEDLEGVLLRPLSDVLLTEKTRSIARQRLLDLAGEQTVPSRQVGDLLRDIQTGGRFFGIEAIMPAFYEDMPPLIRRLNNETLLVVVAPDDAVSTLDSWREVREREFERELDEGRLIFPVDDFMASNEDVVATKDAHIVAYPMAAADVENALEFPWLTNHDVVRIRKQISDNTTFFDTLKEPLRDLCSQYGRIQFVCASKSGVDRMLHRLRGIGFSPRVREDGLDLSPAAPPCADVEITIASLHEGFRVPSIGLAVFTETEVFGRTSRRTARAEMEDAVAIASFRDLEVHDLVVHTDHGIAQYLGLQRIQVSEDIETEFLVLQYADEQKLYVPIHRLGRVQKYVGAPSFGRLDKIGGQSWERTKARVKKQIEGIAYELLQLYAERAGREGHKYSAPDEDFLEFEATFPYEETPHQERAIEEVLSDMTSSRTMDRLVCGDVGFGKTEVAIRAAYKAVQDGRQVAVLVPTTVLADQHLTTFQQRLQSTGARVEMISRFQTAKEVRKTLDDLADGKVDVIVGTHRLLHASVHFNDLGLLIVDEEQRFGVRHKERIKQMRANIDVLTMTATPIPRTLEMAMLGLRDMSVIMTPPPGRLAVSTHLARFRQSTIREGIERELERGGQVFFVHNRVETIYNVREELQQIVPQARIAVGHAQMSPEELENIMHEFIHNKIDVFVSTTIIESGIDIPNANTMFINRADRFGLSQLHQLRGRVGRSNTKAYCYLLVKDPARLTENAKRRLEVVLQHTELGAGLQVAQHDLDLRGAGSLLGDNQSGHIEAIGFELYTELLEEAIADLRGETHEDLYEPEVQVSVATYIPDDYVEDLKQRLGFYKRFSVARDRAEVLDTYAALEDQYGIAPDSVDALKEVILLKLALADMRAERLEATTRQVVIDLRQDTVLDPAKVMDLIRSRAGKYSFKAPMRVIAQLEGAERKSVLAGCSRVMRELQECRA